MIDTLNLVGLLQKLFFLWEQIFPDNDIVGSRENTAKVALVIAVGVLGWLIRRTFGGGTGVR